MSKLLSTSKDINVILRDWKGSGSSLHGDVIPLNIQWGDDFHSPYAHPVVLSHRI